MPNFTIVEKQPGGSGIISIGLAGEATEVWTVIGDRYDYSTEAVRQSGIFPEAYKSYHDDNPRLLLMPIDVQQDKDNPSLFICTLKWTSEPLTPKQEEEQDDNPLDRRARIKIKTIRESETRHRDKYGKPKVNKAGDLFDPPIPSNTAYLQIIIRKNVTAFPDWVFDYIDAVNSVDFVIKGRTIKAKRACIADIELGEIQNDAGIEYCEAIIEIHVKKPRLPVVGESLSAVPSPWQTEQLNEGLHELYTESGVTKRRRISVPSVDEHGVVTSQPAASPVLLNNSGGKLSPVTIDNATYVVTDDHEYLNFNNLSYLWSNA